jgi:DNA-binding transcriptional LysR family regulator
LLAACLAGVGIARIKAIGVQELLDQGRLIELFPAWPGETFPLYALYPSRHLPAAKVKAFIDFVAEVVAGGRKPGEGRARGASVAAIAGMASAPNRRAG